MTASVLLLWPGTDGAAAGNFGVPQLVTLATYLRERTGAKVAIRDLECEKAFGPVDLRRLVGGDDGRGYDIVAFGVYSSFDYLKCLALAEMVRAMLPRATLVAGGYHVSARPTDIVFDGSPFDVAIVGEAERPMVKVVESVFGGERLEPTILGPDPITSLDELPVSDWSYLERYRSVAGRVAPQAQLYLSRGCPFDCAFCMERAKREVSWRSYGVDRAIEEFRALARFIDLEHRTVYIADALFGMRKRWRREFLQQLAASEIRTKKNWLLIRVDMIDDEDLELFGAANCGLGFGLESGDPGQLALIRKAGRLHDYLERMQEVATKARDLAVPWGGNIIVGHPGETEATLRASAAFMRKLFLRKGGTTGFLSVDPFRLYPGSPIDDERARWEIEHGTRFHRPAWWHDGDQEFLSEWVDPSSELDYRRREALMIEEFGPILEGLRGAFRYDGPAAGYFRQALDEQIENFSPRTRLHFAGRYYAWRRYLGEGTRAERERRSDAALTSVAHACRVAQTDRVLTRLDAAARAEHERVWNAAVGVPREQFVQLDDVGASARDTSLLLRNDGEATISAMHAYVRAYAVAGVGRGDRVIDLGSGSGYGTAILARLVGPTGCVVGIEVDSTLVREAKPAVEAAVGPEDGRWEIQAGDARDGAIWPAIDANRVVAGFAIETADIAAWLRARLREAGPLAIAADAVVVLVHAEASTSEQRLVRVRVRRTAGDHDLTVERLEPVRYVVARGASDVASRGAAEGGVEPRAASRLGEAATAADAEGAKVAAARHNRRLSVL